MTIPAKEFYMIRHGQSIANEGGYFSGNMDVALTTLGQEQADEARIIVEGLKCKPHYIFHSHLQRAKNTALAINENLNLPTFETPLLGEHHFGEWEGQPWGDVKPAFYGGQNPPEGETHDEFMHRIQEGISKALNHQEGTPLIACHGGVFRAFYRLYNEEMNGIKNCVLYKFTPAPDKPDMPWDIKPILA